MPVYDYKCDGCGHRFEEIHAMDATPISVCPACGASKARKLLTTGGLIGAHSGKSSSPPPMPSCSGGGCGGGMCGLG
ncbi:MAG: zinc ribbon domain-containing protein [Magnetococcales bacterium]|nr:zinc ribbon domain-containing protein [Magnetococcales bacterium]